MVVDLINAAVVGINGTNARRPDGQAQSPVSNARENPALQQPQVQAGTAQQTPQAVAQTNQNDGVALLNNREQAAASAIQRQANAAPPALNANREQAFVRESTQVATQNTIEINTQQRASTPQAAQQLVTVAQTALESAAQSTPNVNAQTATNAVDLEAPVPVATQLQPEANAPAAPAPQNIEPVQVAAPVVEATPEAPVQPVAFNNTQAPVETAAPVLQSPISALNPQSLVGDVLRPDFNQFVGLRGSVPASSQQPPEVDVNIDAPAPPAEPVDIEA